MDSAPCHGRSRCETSVCMHIYIILHKVVHHTLMIYVICSHSSVLVVPCSTVNWIPVHSGRSLYLPGTISERTGPLSFRVALSDGGVIRCHQDQLRSRMEVEESLVTEENHEVDIGSTPDNTSMTQATDSSSPAVPEEHANLAQSQCRDANTSRNMTQSPPELALETTDVNSSLLPPRGMSMEQCTLLGPGANQTGIMLNIVKQYCHYAGTCIFHICILL